MSEPVRAFVDEMLTAVGLLRHEEIAAAAELIRDARRGDRGVYLCGNGGSASTASHLAADLGKNVRTRTGRPLRVVSLTDNAAWLTALANDEGYAACFVGQLRNHLQPDDLVIGISASGESENVVRAFEFAHARRAHRLALVGFDGGRLARMATRRLWVDSYDYGIVESVHVMVAHLFVRLLSAEERPVTKHASVVGRPTAAQNYQLPMANSQ